MNRAEPQVIEQAKVNGRGAWIYMLPSTLGDLYIVQHEQPGMELIDDYMGWSDGKAAKAFRTIATKMVNGKA